MVRVTNFLGTEGGPPATTTNSRIVFRGPVVKAAVVHGTLKWEVSSATGRMAYTGALFKQLKQVRARSALLLLPPRGRGKPGG